MSPCHDLVSFADGELEPERAAAFREHLRTCEACQVGLVEAMQLSAQLSTLPPSRWRLLWRWLQAQLRRPGLAWATTAPLAVLGLVLAVRMFIPPRHDNVIAPDKPAPH